MIAIWCLCFQTLCIVQLGQQGACRQANYTQLHESAHAANAHTWLVFSTTGWSFRNAVGPPLLMQTPMQQDELHACIVGLPAVVR
jgi:hypothetical protein